MEAFKASVLDYDEAKPVITKTSCKDCIFAELYEDGTHREQTGCRFGRLSTFIERGETEWIEGPNYYMINRLCNYCRNRRWASEQESVDRALFEETKFNYGVVVVESSDAPSDSAIAKILESCDGILNQEVQPERVIVCIKNSNVVRVDLIGCLRAKFGKSNIKYLINYILEDDATDERVVDLAFSDLDNQYYTVVKSGYVLLSSFSGDLNYKLNTEMVQFVMSRPCGPGYNGLTIACLVHYLLKGNRGDTIVRKIEEAAKLENNKEAILSCF